MSHTGLHGLSSKTHLFLSLSRSLLVMGRVLMISREGCKVASLSFISPALIICRADGFLTGLND